MCGTSCEFLPDKIWIFYEEEGGGVTSAFDSVFGGDSFCSVIPDEAEVEAFLLSLA